MTKDGPITENQFFSSDQELDMPSDAEMMAYARSLPEIYREVMAAFPAIEPGRRAGYGLAFQTLAMHFANRHERYGLEEVREACLQLAHRGFVEIKNEIFAHPTELGEQLIAAVSGKPQATTSTIPNLPQHSW